MVFHKQGSSSFLVGIIVVILSIGGIIASTTNLFAKAGDAFEGEECWAALGLQKLGDKAFVSFENNCKTLVKKIPEKRRDIRVGDDVYEQLAQKVANTWRITHEGTIADMWDNDIPWSVFVGSSKCFVMYELNINYIPRNEQLTYADFKSYLLLEEYRTFNSIPYTYLQYIQTKDGNGELAFGDDTQTSLTGEINSFDIRERQPYAISVMSTENSAWKEIFGNNQRPNVVLFSTLEYAENTAGCIRR